MEDPNQSSRRQNCSAVKSLRIVQTLPAVHTVQRVQCLRRLELRKTVVSKTLVFLIQEAREAETKISHRGSQGKERILGLYSGYPGIYGRGKSAKKAKEDIHQAISLYIEDCLADGDKVPVSSAKVVDVDTLSIAVG